MLKIKKKRDQKMGLETFRVKFLEDITRFLANLL